MPQKSVIGSFMLSMILLSLLSCRFNPNLQGSGRQDIQGVWEEDSVAYHNERLQYSRHSFRFTCDSVYLTIRTFAKVNHYPDSCFNNGRWTEYAKGTYQTSGDTLMISATFTKPDFKQKISGCYRIGQYLPAFVVLGEVKETLRLQSLQSHSLIELNLKARTSCVPKPLN